MENKKLITSKFPLKGVFEFKSQMSFLPPVIKGDKFWYDINLRADCWRGSHSTFILQIHCNRNNLDEASEVAEKIYKGEISRPIVRARAVIPDIAKRATVIKCYYATQEELKEQFDNDPNKRVIEIIRGEDEKECAYTSKRVEYKVADDKGLIAYYPVVCSSRTGAHWETNFLVIRYKDKSPKICYEGIRETCRGNTYKVEGCL